MCSADFAAADNVVSLDLAKIIAGVLDLCENGNEEIAYEMLWSGKAYSPAEAPRAREAKEKYAA